MHLGGVGVGSTVSKLEEELFWAYLVVIFFLLPAAFLGSYTFPKEEFRNVQLSIKVLNGMLQVSYFFSPEI